MRWRRRAPTTTSSSSSTPTCPSTGAPAAGARPRPERAPLGEVHGLFDRGQRRDVDLAGEHVDALDRGLLGQQLGRLLLEPGGVLAREVRLARVLIGERVEDAERRRADAQREPQGRAVLRVDDVQRAAQESLDLLLAAGLGLQAYEQRSC